MRSSDPHDELQRDFEPGPLPVVGPDGVPVLESARADPPPRPSLCEAGPCRHYHRFAIDMIAAQPIPIRRKDGTTVQPPPVTHTQTHHYCYPDVGIEFKLDTPIASCNRWSPPTVTEVGDQERLRFQYQQSNAWRAYEEAVRTWEESCAALAASSAGSIDNEMGQLLEQHQQDRNREVAAGRERKDNQGDLP